MAEARYIRAFAHRLTKNEHVNPPFPSDVFDVDEAENSAVKTLYKLSEIDEFARSNPREKAIGYISVVITQLHIVTNFKRNMLMSNECCGIPIFASSLKAKCRQCEKEHTLRINPRIVSFRFTSSVEQINPCLVKTYGLIGRPADNSQLGNVIDETGQISTGKLIFSDAAWEQLLGRTAQQLVTAPLDVMKYLEQRLLFLRLHLGLGVFMGDEEIGRLVVWCVKM